MRERLCTFQDGKALHACLHMLFPSTVVVNTHFLLRTPFQCIRREKVRRIRKIHAVILRELKRRVTRARVELVRHVIAFDKYGMLFLQNPSAIS